MSIQRFLSSPLALWPGHSQVILDALNRPASAQVPGADRNARKKYEIIAGVAVIPICDILVHTPTYYWGETTYNSIADSFFGAIADQDVKGIALHINSPGGEVSGCFDLADAMFSVRGIKPIHAIVDEAAYSAAYALASCADKIVLPRTGGVGSIGVIGMHIDITQMLAQAGIKVTTIKFGEHKDDSQPTTPLSSDAEAAMQADINKLGEMFVQMVARHRGLDASDVRETEAGCFLGEDGVTAGLADAIMSAEEALVSLIEEVSTN
jgi:signal peptide peptidase SppA